MVPELTSRGWRVVAGVRGGRARASDLDAEVIDLDITNDEQRQRAAASLERLDCLINNAGRGMFGSFEETSESELREGIETNFLGTLLLTRACLPLLRASRGRIVNISSVLGYTGLPMNSIYCAGKFAVEGWSESVHHELRPHGVKVTLVEPGGFRTRFGDNARWPAATLDVYKGQRAAVRAFREKQMSRKGSPPEIVARAVTKLLSSTGAPIRLRVGVDARAMWLLRKWLPEKLGDRLFARIFGQLSGVRE
jgi:NAD(P)-dependent dehydrogenase (short-subunit alcohol dehydrogenase family)